MPTPLPSEGAPSLTIGGLTFTFRGVNGPATRAAVERMYEKSDELRKMLTDVSTRYKNVDIVLAPGSTRYTQGRLRLPNFDGVFSGQAAEDPDTWRVLIDTIAVIRTRVEPPDHPYSFSFTRIPTVDELVAHEIGHGKYRGAKQGDEEREVVERTDIISRQLGLLGFTGHFEDNPVTPNPLWRAGEQHPDPSLRLYHAISRAASSVRTGPRRASSARAATGNDWRPKRDPWMPPDHDEGVVYAVRALGEGNANKGQQKLLWDWLMYVTAASEGWADLSFRPGGHESERATAFAESKRFVGLQTRKMLHPAMTPMTRVGEQPAATRTRASRKPRVAA